MAEAAVVMAAEVKTEVPAVVLVTRIHTEVLQVMEQVIEVEITDQQLVVAVVVPAKEAVITMVVIWQEWVDEDY